MWVIQEQIEKIEKEIREMPYHKGTERHIGILRARLAKLKDKLTDVSSRKSSGGVGYAVKQQGDATIVLVGAPSVGKSTLLNSLTNAKSRVAPYAFTTVTVIPGMMEYKDAKVQILDVPGLIRGAEEGKGRGREVLSVIRGCNLVIVITDFNDLEAFSRITQTLEKNGVRLNKFAPKVTIEKKLGGGVVIQSNINQELSKVTIKEFAIEFGIRNAEIKIKERLTMDRLIDAFSKSRVYIPALFLVNKSDEISDINHHAQKLDQFNALVISAEKKLGLEELKEEIWKKLEFVRVYLVKPEEEPSFNNPIIMKRGQILYDVAQKIGSEFAQGKTRAKIWGTSAKFPGQEVSLSTKLQEGIQVRFL